MHLRIKDLREDNDYKQNQIAEYLSCAQNTYSQYETGERNIPLELLCKLADLYNTSLDYLVCRTDEIKPYRKSKVKYEDR